MQIITVKNLKSGMRLARTLYDKDGRVLLYAGVTLTRQNIQRICQLNFNSLYIRDPDDPFEAEILEPVQAETKAKAVTIVKNTMAAMIRDAKTDIDQLKFVVADMVDQILIDNQIIYNMVDIRTHDDYTFAHSVNVGVLALLIGAALNYNRNKLIILGTGAILHDIGKIFIASSLLNKPKQLQPDEYEIVKSHAVKGYQLLKERNVSYVASHVAYEHHEREDGTGYPRGLTGAKIHHYAKIVAVADVFDAMTADRVYRKAIPTHLVLQELRNLAGIKFSKPVVDSFVKIIAPYPLGSVVKLTNGAVAKVIKVTKTECLVKIVQGTGAGEKYDLFQNPDLIVEEVINT